MDEESSVGLEEDINVDRQSRPFNSLDTRSKSMDSEVITTEKDIFKMDLIDEDHTEAYDGKNFITIGEEEETIIGEEEEIIEDNKEEQENKRILLEKLNRLIKRKIKYESFVSYPVHNLSHFIELSKRQFLRKYYGKKLKKMNFVKSDFQVIYTLSDGSYSRVYLTEWKEKYVVMKIRDKKHLVSNSLVSQTKREIRILNFIKFPFLMNFTIVQDNLYLYYLMSFACGNTLQKLIETRVLQENEAKFYILQIVLSIEFLHAIGCIHRNIDPNNVLICHDGYTKLTGFSNVKIGLGRQKSLANFSTLYACSDLYNKKHDYHYDLYCLGVTIYCVCSKVNPFNKIIDFNQINNRRKNNKIIMPDYFSQNLKDVIAGLTDDDMCERTGARCSADIKMHDWFKEIPIIGLINKRIRPPFIPQCKDNPVTNFRTLPTRQLQEAKFDPFDLVFRDVFD